MLYMKGFKRGNHEFSPQEFFSFTFLSYLCEIIDDH